MAGSSVILENISSSIVGHIGAIRGEVLILRAVGGLSVAKKGDPIYEDDIVSTQDNAAALVYTDAGVLTFSRSATIQFNPSLTERIQSEFSNGSLGLGSETPLEFIQQLVENGGNLEDLLPKTAAPSPDDEPQQVETTSTFEVIVWQRSDNQLIPVSGFSARNNTFSENFSINDIGDQPPVLPADDISDSIGPEEPEIIFIPRDLVSQDDILSLQEDSGVNSASVASNDSSQDSNPLTFQLVAGSGVENGTLVFNSDGTYSYTPNDDFFGTEQFQYLVTNPVAGESAIQTVTIQVANLNDTPVALTDNVSTDEDVAFAGNVLINDQDVDGDSLVVNTTPVVNVTNGTLVLNANGTFVYTPNANFNGSDSFIYSISDGNGGQAQATVNITVNPIVDIPLAVADSFSVDEDGTLSGLSVLSNDSHGDSLPLTVTTTPISDVSNGSLTLNANGTFTYTPNANFNGTDSFIYQVNDGNGGSAQATATITVNSVNDLPVALADSFSVDEDNSLNASVLSNDSDVDGDTLVVNTTPVSDVSNGSLTLNADGTFDYTPNANFNGVDSFTYQVSDGNGGSATAVVNITVNSVNDIPVATADSFSTDEDVVLDGNVLTNDSDADSDTLTVNTTPVSNVSNGSLTLNADGTFSYTPNANFNGEDSFTYQVSDGNGGSATATVTITVNSVDDLTTASETESTNEDTPLVASVANGDSTTSGGPLSYSLVSGPANGTLSLINASTGNYTYTPNAEFNGADSFQYLVTDSASGESSVETVSITVNSVADLNANDDTLSVPFETLTAGNVSTNDTTTSSGGDAGLTFTQLTDVSNGVLVFNADGSYTYNPTGIGEAGGVDSFTYLVTDAASGESSVQTVNITIDPANGRPEGTDNSATIDEDDSYTLLVSDFGFSDPIEGDSFANVRIDTLPSQSSLTLSGVAVTAGQLISVAAIVAGNLVYTPDANANGTPQSSFTFSVQDSAGSIDASPNTFSLNVNAVDDVPVATNDSFDVIQDGSLTTTLANGLLANDFDGDGNTLTVNATPIVNTSNGTLNLNTDGTFTYTPDNGFNGTDSFTYEIDDGTGNTAQATVQLSVDFPTATIVGTGGADNLIGSAGVDDDIFPGGVGSGQSASNVQGVQGSSSQAQQSSAGSGNDRLIFDADDLFVTNARASNDGGHIRIRDFTVGDVTTDTDADTLVLGNFLRAGDPTFDGTAADALRFFHFAGANGQLLYIDREGGLGDAGSAARNQSDGPFDGVDGGASLFLEFTTQFFSARPDGNQLNTVEHIQNLIDLGFLDLS